MSGEQSAAEGVIVAIRMRPMNERELRDGQEQIYKCLPGQHAIAQCNGDVDGVTYFYDKVGPIPSVSSLVVIGPIADSATPASSLSPLCSSFLLYTGL